MKYCNISSFPPTKDKAFCMETYFTYNSYKVVEVSGETFSVVMLHQKAEFLTVFTSLESMDGTVKS